MRKGWALCSLVFALFLVGATASTKAYADEASAEAFARVVVDEAELRSGPGATFRILEVAKRGDTFALDGRPGSGYWLKVVLPDGRAAYVVGDAVQPFAVTPGEEGAPSRPGLFAPPPLAGSRGGLAIVGGILRVGVVGGNTESFGYLEARPSLVIHKTLSLDAFIADGLTSDGSQILYGAGATVYLAPTWALCPFVGAAGGGYSVLPNTDSFVLRRQDLFLARAGGGLLFALRNRILVRLEATHVVLFNAETYKTAQTYAGGLGVYF